MKNGALVFLAVFVALGLSWCGFVLAPVRQLGGAKQTTILNSSDLYPVGRPGDANLGSAGLSRQRLRRLPHRTGPAERRCLRCDRAVLKQACSFAKIAESERQIGQ